MGFAPTNVCFADRCVSCFTTLSYAEEIGFEPTPPFDTWFSRPVRYRYAVFFRLSEGWDSNPRRSVWKTDILATELLSQLKVIVLSVVILLNSPVKVGGIEPPTRGPKPRVLPLYYTLNLLDFPLSRACSSFNIRARILERPLLVAILSSSLFREAVSLTIKYN